MQVPPTGAVLPPTFCSHLIADVPTDSQLQNKYNFQNVRACLHQCNNSLLTSEIIVSIHLRLSLHWILAIVVPDTCKLMLIDSYPNKVHFEITQILLQWLQDTDIALNMPSFPALWTTVSSNTLHAYRPVQNDSTRCGVFVALTAEY